MKIKIMRMTYTDESDNSFGNMVEVDNIPPHEMPFQSDLNEIDPYQLELEYMEEQGVTFYLTQ
jgi:hypothetical protein